MTNKNANKIGYKKTKLGWIPKNWEVVRLKDIVVYSQSGLSRKLSNNDIGLPVIRSNNIKNNTIDFSEIKYWYKNDPQGANTQNYVLQNNDILLNFINSLAQIGKCAIFINSLNRDTIFTTNIMRLKLNPTKITPYFYILQTLNERYLYYIGSIAKPAINQASFTSNDYKMYKISLPPITEQEKIAEILSAWDVGIETLEKLIEQKEILHKALMKNLLMGKKRLSEFCKNIEYKRTKLGPIPVDWQLKPLKLLFDKRMQKYSGNTEHNIFTNSATKGVVLQNEYFDRSIVTEENASNYYIVGENDFMYNPRISQSAPAGPINRNKLGITGIASPLYTIFKAKHDTIVDFYEQYFSSNLWNNSMFMVANQGARHDRLNITNNDFMNMPLPYPPLKEQEKIANVLIESYKEIQILNSKLEKLKDQKKGLMQKLLTGQIRVKI